MCVFGVVIGCADQQAPTAPCLTLHSSHANRSERPRRTIVFEYKDPAARLLTGSFSKSEASAAGLMVRGRDPNGELLSAL